LSRAVLLALGSGALGGGTTHALGLMERLRALGWSTALAVDPEGPALEAARRSGGRAFAVPFAGGRLSPRAWRALRAAVRETRPSLLHAHGSRAALACALLARAGSLGGAPLVYTEHGLATDVARSAPVRGLAALGERVSLSTATRVIALSEYSRARIAALAPAAASRMRVVPNAVPDWAPARERSAVRRELGIAADAVVVGAVMRLVPQKSPLAWIQAAKRASLDRPGAAFLVVGDGPLRAETEAAARAAGLAIVFAGSRDDVADLLGAMDIFALSSAWEGVPIALLEAMAASLPVVATDVGGVSSIVEDGRTGVLVPSGDVARLGDAMSALIGDGPMRARLGAAGLARVRESHRLDDLGRRVAAVYEEALARG